MGCSGLVLQAFNSLLVKPLFPFVTGLCAYTVFCAELGKTHFILKRTQYKFQFLTHDIYLLPGHGQYLHRKLLTEFYLKCVTYVLVSPRLIAYTSKHSRSFHSRVLPEGENLPQANTGHVFRSCGPSPLLCLVIYSKMSSS